MRIMGLVFSLSVTVSLTAMALTYVPDYVGQQRIYVEGRSAPPPDPKPYRSYGDVEYTNPDTARTVSSDSAPYH